MSNCKQWTTSLTPEEAVERLGLACAALDKIAHYTSHDEAYFGNPGEFAKAALDKVMAPANPHGFGLCENPSHPEYNGQPCQCVHCRPVGYCVENPCLDCEGPTDGCQPPDEEGGQA